MKKQPNRTTPTNRKQKVATSPTEPRRLRTRNIPRSVEAMLWGRTAGRCEFEGCNKLLSRSSVTQEQVNVGQKAHIYAFSTRGPRGNRGVAEAAINDLGNLMLVCHECHVKIDRAPEDGRYTAEMLQGMKARHEWRVEIVTAIAPDRRSHVLLYGANIGEHNLHLALNEAAGAMFPDRYPAEVTPLALGTVNSSFQDNNERFWEIEAEQLRTLFDRRVRERIAGREIGHLSVFALAPQPLLVLLGTLLGDIVPMDVYQRHREPSTWAWPTAAGTPGFEVRDAASTAGHPALVLAISATVTPDRITAVLGPDASIWTVTVPVPHNDILKSRAQLSQFRMVLRPLLDRIKTAHGQTTPLHVFPVAPVSFAVEFGRIRMPKADMPWRIYDQVNDRGGFVPALSIPHGE